MQDTPPSTKHNLKIFLLSALDQTVQLYSFEIESDTDGIKFVESNTLSNILYNLIMFIDKRVREQKEDPTVVAYREGVHKEIFECTNLFFAKKN